VSFRLALAYSHSIVASIGCFARTVAGTDCGFGTIVGDTQVSEDVVWAKLEAMRDGAAIASQRLWG
jgi:5-methyltetrahydropteroyltriglutamate--homocysteine methyltransferase